MDVCGFAKLGIPIQTPESQPDSKPEICLAFALDHDHQVSVMYVRFISFHRFISIELTFSDKRQSPVQLQIWKNIGLNFYVIQRIR